MVNDRYDRGFEKLKEIDGKAGERVIESLKDISPDEMPAADHFTHAKILNAMKQSKRELAKTR
jgi:hypothetical protein